MAVCSSFNIQLNRAIERLKGSVKIMFYTEVFIIAYTCIIVNIVLETKICMLYGGIMLKAGAL